jgi:hypothetical protein
MMFVVELVDPDDDEPSGSEPAADELADRAAGRADDERWRELD